MLGLSWLRLASRNQLDPSFIQWPLAFQLTLDPYLEILNILLELSFYIELAKVALNGRLELYKVEPATFSIRLDLVEYLIDVLLPFFFLLSYGGGIYWGIVKILQHTLQFMLFDQAILIKIKQVEGCF